jgi:pimeloyl-ACP methyl ester carboxylesterase
VADLDDVLRDACPGERPAIVGESWGAMLALAWAAEHPDRAGPLALVGCGTFDATARARLRETLDARKTVELRERLARLTEACPDPAARTVAAHDLSRGLYSVGPLPEAPDDSPPFDLRAHKETWADMLRLQAEGVYPAAFAAIRSPVLMLHGDYDPHPGPMIYDGLLAAIPQLEYREYSQCGHHPWRERHVRAAFFADLASWLRVHSSGGL